MLYTLDYLIDWQGGVNVQGQRCIFWPKALISPTALKLRMLISSLFFEAVKRLRGTALSAVSNCWGLWDAVRAQGGSGAPADASYDVERRHVFDWVTPICTSNSTFFTCRFER